MGVCHMKNSCRIRSLTCLLCVSLLCGALFGCSSTEVEQAAPIFPWSAFQRYWSKGATDITSIEMAQPGENGYYVDYGEGVSLQIFMQEEIVTGVRLTYTSLPENLAGGLRFKKIVNHMIYLGSFRWSREEANSMRAFFGPIDAITKEYRYKNAYFKRSFDGVQRWTFQWDFIPYTTEVWTYKNP